VKDVTILVFSKGVFWLSLAQSLVWSSLAGLEDDGCSRSRAGERAGWWRSAVSAA
jgi:hypothetical protein